MLDLLVGALITNLEWFPYFGFLLILSIFYTDFIEPYRNLNKLQVSSKLMKYGHALAFVIGCLYALACTFFAFFGFILMFKISSSGGFFSLVTGILAMLIFLSVSILPSMFINSFFYDLVSDEAEKKRSYAKKMKSSFVTMTDNEKKEIIKKLKQEYLADLKENFWKGRLIENKKL